MKDENLRRVEREIRVWANRPPRRSPAAARTRVLARLEKRRQRAPWRVFPARALLVVGLVIAALFVVLRVPRDGSFEPNELADAERSASHMLVVELSSGTTVYFTLAAQPIVPSPSSPGTSLGDG